jgi:hypothetical protein
MPKAKGRKKNQTKRVLPLRSSSIFASSSTCYQDVTVCQAPSAYTRNSLSAALR